MKRIQIVMRTTNDSFDDLPEYETARILRQIADDLEAGDRLDGSRIYDANGNDVGRITVDR